MLRNLLSVACTNVTPERNIELVQMITAEIPHNIIPLYSEHDLALFTCVMHALGFSGQERYVAVATLPGYNVYAGKEFVEWLIAGGHLTEVAVTQARVGSIVMYFDNGGEFTHVGLMASHGRVESKWGTVALYEHDLLEVPLNYGSMVRYFENLPYEQAIELFYDFAEAKGVVFE